jgi:hypothetical protein
MFFTSLFVRRMVWANGESRGTRGRLSPSPGGWHQGTRAGFWLGAFRPELSVTVMRTNNPARRPLVGFGFDF